MHNISIVIDQDGQRALSAFYPIGKYGDHSEPLTASAGDNFNDITLWFLKKDPEGIPLRGHTSPVTALDISSDGRYGISGCWGQVVRVWDLDKAEERWAFPDHRGKVTVVRITLDGRLAVSASEDKTLKVWDLEAGRLLTTFTYWNKIENCWISPDGELLVVQLISRKSGSQFQYILLSEFVEPDNALDS
jgi:WD40 repeat protein